MPAYLTAAALLVFCGAVGKSAQFPLHVWLPDAMEGPTPVSALIHAATMVAAGVYMLVRVGFLIDASAAALARHRLDRHHHRRARRAHGDAAERHQAHPRLLHALATRLHGDGRRARVGPKRRCSIFSRTRSSRRCSSSAPARSSTCCITSRTSGRWASLETHAAHLPHVSHRHARADRLSRVRADSSARTPSWCSPTSATFRFLRLGAFTALLTAFYMTRLVVVVFFGSPAQRSCRARSGESPAVMVIPLLILAVPAALGGFGFFARRFLVLPNEKAPS